MIAIALPFLPFPSDFAKMPIMDLKTVALPEFIPSRKILRDAFVALSRADGPYSPVSQEAFGRALSEAASDPSLRDRGEPFLSWAISQGLAETAEPDPHFQRNATGSFAHLTLSGRAVAAASLSPRLPKDKAWDRVAAAYIRLSAFSGALPSDHGSWRPAGLLLFGSMLDPSRPDHGDADLCVIFAQSEDPEERKMLRRSEKSSPELLWSWHSSDEINASKEAKLGDGFLSMHSWSDVSELAEQASADKPMRALFLPFSIPLGWKIFESAAKDIAIASAWSAAHPAEASDALSRFRGALERSETPGLAEHFPLPEPGSGSAPAFGSPHFSLLCSLRAGHLAGDAAAAAIHAGKGPEHHLLRMARMGLAGGAGIARMTRLCAGEFPQQVAGALMRYQALVPEGPHREMILQVFSRSALALQAPSDPQALEALARYERIELSDTGGGDSYHLSDLLKERRGKSRKPSRPAAKSSTGPA